MRLECGPRSAPLSRRRYVVADLRDPGHVARSSPGAPDRSGTRARHRSGRAADRLARAARAGARPARRRVARPVVAPIAVPRELAEIAAALLALADHAADRVREAGGRHPVQGHGGDRDLTEQRFRTCLPVDVERQAIEIALEGGECRPLPVERRQSGRAASGGRSARIPRTTRATVSMPASAGTTLLRFWPSQPAGFFAQARKSACLLFQALLDGRRRLTDHALPASSETARRL